tara:strand:+ start:89092 stop:90213 length:1122 start_codon:yes stop_codon:yes gene_type:complete
MSLSQQVQPHKTPAPLGIMASVVIAALGGFVGGLLIEHGPTYFNVHVSQPVLGESQVHSDFVSATPTPFLEPALHTNAQPDAEPAVLAAGAEARIVVHDDARSYLVLQAKAPKVWGTGAIALSSGENQMLSTLSQSIDLAKLPTEQAAWLGASVTMYDDQGFACSGTVDSLALLEQFAGDGMSEGGWDEYGEGPLLVARISPDKGSCAEASWGRHAALSAPSIGRLSKGTKADRREARRAFRSTPAYRKFQKEFLADGQKGKWDAYWDSELTIRVIRSPEQELVFVEAQVGGCGEFEAQLGTLFERKADGTLHALSSENSFLADIEAAADIDGDGDLDFITQGDAYNRALMRRDDSGLTTQSENNVGIYFCRC